MMSARQQVRAFWRDRQTRSRAPSETPAVLGARAPARAPVPKFAARSADPGDVNADRERLLTFGAVLRLASHGEEPLLIA